MAFLDQGVVPFAENLTGIVADDHTANWAPSFIVSLLRQENGQAHEIGI